MNIKKLLFCVTLSVSCMFAFAYNPPLSGENVYNFSSPSMVSAEASVAGGSFFQVNPEHLSLNPAIAATEQRVIVSAGYSALIGKNKTNNLGQAFTMGAIIPSRFGVFSASTQGAFMHFDDMTLGNTLTLRGSFSKDILDSLYVGFGVAGGFGVDWALYADVGVVYVPDEISWLPFMSDIRLGASLTQLGKTFLANTTGVKGIDKTTTAYPSMITPRLGFAGTLFQLERVKSGISLDVSFPGVQNVVFDTNLRFEFLDMISVSTGWQFNLVEAGQGKANYYPSVSIGAKFDFTAEDDSFLAKQGLKENGITASGTFKALSNDITIISAGASTYLGLEDTEAPAIILWEE